MILPGELTEGRPCAKLRCTPCCACQGLLFPPPPHPSPFSRKLRTKKHPIAGRLYTRPDLGDPKGDYNFDNHPQGLGLSPFAAPFMAWFGWLGHGSGRSVAFRAPLIRGTVVPIFSFFRGHVCVYIYISMYTSIYTYRDICVYMNTYIYICVYIFTKYTRGLYTNT